MQAQPEVADGSLAQRYQATRQQTLNLCGPLELEDYGVQPTADASPPKWHLAHTTWFFETFILKVLDKNFVAHHDQYEQLFNSYYNGVGQPYPRAKRGFLSRPTVAQVEDYRTAVDEKIVDLLMTQGDSEELVERVVLGLNHEQQHQELLLTDIKFNFGHNPLYPPYGGQPVSQSKVNRLHFSQISGGIVEVGAGNGFAFDNERPRHQVLLQPFAFADRLTTNSEYLEFIEAGGYHASEHWLSEGWQAIEGDKLRHPLYWLQRDGQWFEYRLDGLQPLDPNLPAVHLSGHEAFAFASWCNARLPTEFEWEHVAQDQLIRGTFLESGCLHPSAATDTQEIAQLFGDVWQWTSSNYGPYPGYRTLPGTLGEYNGKFMSSQLVLRGGSCVTPKSHFRSSYRNFFYAPDRWQFTGIRLAKNVE
ncbi:MAG: ergothioneine biosynthesis protein EgtB [Gammaproteobacteria bacterium]|nr:ergothioneine biosynthesis protein EgtB [Gammaproteobacteria bacterium]